MTANEINLMKFVITELYPSNGNPEQKVQLLTSDVSKLLAKNGEPITYIEVPLQVARQLAAFHIRLWEEMKND